MADKIVLNNITSFQNDATAAALLNSNNTAILAGIDNTLSRDGTSPNQMTATIDMNSNPIINLPAPSTLGEPLRLADINSVISVTPSFQVPGSVRYRITNVNLNAANTDNPISIILPNGVTRWRYNNTVVTHPSTSITTATAGLFSGTGGTGAVFANNQSLAGLTTSAENTVGNATTLTAAGFSGSLNVTTVYFRVGTAQGSAATADVTLVIALM